MKSPRQTQIPLTRIQKLIGERMLASKRTKPCFYLERRTDVTVLMAGRHKLSKALGVKITSNTFLIRALALAARRFPLMVGRLERDEQFDTPVVRIPESVNVGFAVNSPQGLVVPVIRHADTDSLAEIATCERLLIQKARGNKLALEDIEGETIALSNLGPYDVDSFVAIVPPPTTAVLAAGNIVRSVIPVGNQVEVRRTTVLSLAADHSIVDPAYGAQCLNHIAELLSHSERLL